MRLVLNRDAPSCKACFRKENSNGCFYPYCVCFFSYMATMRHDVPPVLHLQLRLVFTKSRSGRSAYIIYIKWVLKIGRYGRACGAFPLLVLGLGQRSTYIYYLGKVGIWNRDRFVERVVTIQKSQKVMSSLKIARTFYRQSARSRRFGVSSQSFVDF